MRIVFVAALLLLAGCADEPRVSKVGEHTHGTFYTCPDGTELDPASFPDHHHADFDIASKCPDEDGGASISLSKAPATGVAYQELEIRWEVVPGTEGLKQSGVRIASESGQPGAFDSWGTEVAHRGSEGRPGQFKAGYTPVEPGVYYLRAYAEAPSETLWSDAQKLTISEIPESGTVIEVDISLGLPRAQIEPGRVEVTAGDAVRFVNNDLLAHRLRTTDAPVEFDTGDLDGNGGASDAIPLFRLGEYDYHEPDGSLSGTIVVTMPTG